MNRLSYLVVLLLMILAEANHAVGYGLFPDHDLSALFFIRSFTSSVQTSSRG